MTGEYIHCVFREPEFSPGKVEQDAGILLDTAAQLAGRGFDVRLGRGSDPIARNGRRPSLVLAMCQGREALERLKAVSTGVPVVNSPQAIANCYRETMIALLARAGVRCAPAAMTDTGVAAPGIPDPPVWVKRADVHAMEPGDVVYAETSDEAAQAMSGLCRRGVRRAVVQRHVPGTVVKFYAVAEGEFFRCRRPEREIGFRLGELRELARAAASALGLGVYGGDAVIDSEGRPTLIDVNDWPSFSWCREDAARAIAGYVIKRWLTAAQRERREEGSAIR